MNRLKRVFLLLTLSPVLAGGSLYRPASPAFAHGVGWRQCDTPAVALEFVYASGQKMAYAEARVFAPDDPEHAWQTGRTDGEGHLSFVPHLPGIWRAVAKDGEGHRTEAEIDVTPEFLKGGTGVSQIGNSSDKNPPVGLDLALRALLGVSLLFNVAALVLLKRGGRNHAHQ